jgi:hypothetical protein
MGLGLLPAVHPERVTLGLHLKIVHGPAVQSGQLQPELHDGLHVAFGLKPAAQLPTKHTCA